MTMKLLRIYIKKLSCNNYSKHIFSQFYDRAANFTLLFYLVSYTFTLNVNPIEKKTVIYLITY